MKQYGKKLSIILSIILVILSFSGLNVFAGENEISVFGANGDATQIEQGTSMKMTVSGVSTGKSVSWSVTDLEGAETGLATIEQTGALTAVLTASSSAYGTVKVIAAQNGGAGKTGEQIIHITRENLVTVDDADPAIRYEGAGSGEDWETTNHSSYYLGTGKSVTTPEDDAYSSSEPAYAEFTFTGTGIQWIGESNYHCGIADVYLDGAKVSTVDSFIAPENLTQFINFSREGLPYGEHTIKVVSTGQKNPASTLYPGTRVLIDGFRYLSGSPTEEVDKTRLNEKILEAQILPEDAYSQESWSVLQQSLAIAISINDNPEASQEAVDAALADLVKAISELVHLGPYVVLSGADRVPPEENFQLNVNLYHVSQDVYAEKITLSFDENIFEYVSAEGANDNIQIVTEEATLNSIKIIAANIGGIKGEQTPVLQLTFKGKSGVRDATAAIAVTKAELGIAPEGTVINAGLGTRTISIGTFADKTILNNKINSAEALFAAAVVGDQPGQYPKEAKDALRAAIDKAILVFNDVSATQLFVDNAVSELNIAVDSFKNTVVKETKSPDINTDGTTDVVDLAIVAYYYGKTSASEDWEQAKVADLNLDGKIDISDLAYVAIKILQ